MQASINASVSFGAGVSLSLGFSADVSTYGKYWDNPFGLTGIRLQDFGLEAELSYTVGMPIPLISKMGAYALDVNLFGLQGDFAFYVGGDNAVLYLDLESVNADTYHWLHDGFYLTNDNGKAFNISSIINAAANAALGEGEIYTDFIKDLFSSFNHNFLQIDYDNADGDNNYTTGQDPFLNMALSTKEFGIDSNDSISLYNSKFIDAKLKVAKVNKHIHNPILYKLINIENNIALNHEDEDWSSFWLVLADMIWKSGETSSLVFSYST